MTKAKQVLIILIISLLTQVAFSQNCKKCDTEKLLDLSENIESLNYEIVKSFLCTFDSTCFNNAEFSEWSNELLFELIENNVDLMNEVLYDLGHNYIKLIVNELESPIKDFDLMKTFLLVENSKGPKDLIDIEKRAIKIAASKEGLKIE